MENINNVEKMSTFIYHEAKEKANEILIKAHEEYNLDKARVVLFESEKIDKDICKKTKQLNIELNTRRSEILNKYKMKIMEKRVCIIMELMDRVQKELEKRKYSEELVEEALLAIREDDLVLYVDGDYRRVVERVGLKVEVRKGDGLVVESRDGRSRCDNSYKARIEVFKNNNLDYLAKKLFQ